MAGSGRRAWVSTVVTVGLACALGACGSSPAPVVVPRLLAPLSTSYVTSLRPILHWVLPTDAVGAHVQVCRDRPCLTVLAEFDAMGSSGASTDDLPVGVAFWRAFWRRQDATDVVPTATWQFTVRGRGAEVNTSWGTTLDVNGDGYADVAVAAEIAARTYVYLGGPTGVDPSPAVVLAGSDNATNVAAAGDVNGDGFGDVLVGGPGEVSIYLGSATGLSPSPSVILTRPKEMNPISGGFIGPIEEVGAAAGDIDGDGYGDVAVSVPSPDEGLGRIFVYLGSGAGPSNSPATVLRPTGYIGPNGGAIGAGDVDGDGYADVAVNVVDSDLVSHALLYRGGAAGLIRSPTITLDGSPGTAADVNGDGYSDIVLRVEVPPGETARQEVHLGGPTGWTTSSWATLAGQSGPSAYFRALRAGDVNGDGEDDIVTRDFNYNMGAGRVDVYFGAQVATSISDSPPASLLGPDGPNGQFGLSAASGDINDDGYADIVIGAQAVDGNAGRAYVYLGSASGLSATPTQTLISPDGGLFGNTIARASRITGPKRRSGRAFRLRRHRTG